MSELPPSIAPVNVTPIKPTESSESDIPVNVTSIKPIESSHAIAPNVPPNNIPHTVNQNDCIRRYTVNQNDCIRRYIIKHPYIIISYIITFTMIGCAIYIALSDRAAFKRTYVDISSIIYVKEIVPNAYKCAEIKNCECIESLYTPCKEKVKDKIAGECSGGSKCCKYEYKSISVNNVLKTERYCEKRVKNELCNTVVGTCGNPKITIGYEYNKKNYEYEIKHKCPSVSDCMDNFIKLYQNDFSTILYVNTTNPDVIYTSEPTYPRPFRSDVFLLSFFGACGVLFATAFMAVGYGMVMHE